MQYSGTYAVFGKSLIQISTQGPNILTGFSLYYSAHPAKFWNFSVSNLFISIREAIQINNLTPSGKTETN
jgi:hypothetical protein